MARTRALLTENEREWLSKDVTESGSRKYQIVSEVRNRIDDELVQDIEVLAQHHPDLLDELREVVCEPTEEEMPICIDCGYRVMNHSGENGEYFCQNCNAVLREEDVREA